MRYNPESAPEPVDLTTVELDLILHEMECLGMVSYAQRQVIVYAVLEAKTRAGHALYRGQRDYWEHIIRQDAALPFAG